MTPKQNLIRKMNNNLTTNASDEAVNPRFCKGAVMLSLRFYQSATGRKNKV